MGDLYDEKYHHTLKGVLLFELKSFVGRLFFGRDAPIKVDEINLLNLGCGDTHIDGWVNADFFSGMNPFRNTRRADWMLDLRFPLRCA